MKKAKAAVFVGANKDFEVRDYPITSPKKGQALLKLLVSGICGTDIHIKNGKLAMQSPMIIGHEFIGEIVEINGEGLTEGDKVIFNMATPCGKCLLCRNGDSANCLDFKVSFAQNPEEAPHLHGGFAQYCYADIENLVKIPSDVDYVSAAAFPCAGPTIIHALKCGGIFKNNAAGIETAVVQGTGPVGLFATMWLSKAEVKNILVSARNTNSIRAKTAIKMGASEIVPVENLEECTLEITKNIGADLVVECSGNPEAFVQGINILRNRGLYLVPGQYSNSGDVHIGPQIITFKALQVIGSSQYDSSDVEDYIKFLRKNPDLQKIMRGGIKGYKVEEINQALACAENHNACKTVLCSEGIL